MVRFAVVSLILLTGCESATEKFENSFVEACVDVYKERLRSPTSFMLAATPTVKTQTFAYAFFQRETDRFSARATTPEQHEMAALLRNNAYDKQADPDWKIATTDISYDAANAFGTLVRGRFTCVSEYQESDLPSTPDSFDIVFVNGQTHLSWLTSQIAGN